jgi:hypothetical protein
VGTSTFNVTPMSTGAYFQKINCFCFTEQRSKPGERVKWRWCSMSIRPSPPTASSTVKDHHAVLYVLPGEGAGSEAGGGAVPDKRKGNL